MKPENTDYVTEFLFWKGFFHWAGKWLSDYEKDCFRRWVRQERPFPRHCDICGERVSRKGGSLDHIIPLSICYKLGLDMLRFDSRNFALAHKYCNSIKGSTIDCLPAPVYEKITALAAEKQLTL